tara:strand:- start:434 stop:829 length:396 start_codon:yes stop_codon:yes gene_type:complete
MMKLIKVLAATSAILSLTACSTMFNNGSQSLMLNSSNGSEGIKVNVTGPDGSYPTTLPATVASSKSSFADLSVTVTDKCYDSTQTNVSKSVTPSYWANILNGYGFVIDWATGAMWKYDNNTSVIVNKKDNC